jgi:hypothetical protein
MPVMVTMAADKRKAAFIEGISLTSKQDVMSTNDESGCCGGAHLGTAIRGGGRPGSFSELSTCAEAYGQQFKGSRVATLDSKR